MGGAEDRSRYVIGFIKVGERRYMEPFLERGAVYFNTLGVLRKAERETGRGDPDEGLYRVFQASQIGEMKWGNIDLKPGLVGQVKLAYNESAYYNVLCLYGITKPGEIDPRCGYLAGQHGPGAFVVIKRPLDFLDRLRRKLSLLGHQDPEWDFVEYVDRSTHHGDMGVFRKYAEYSYQSEFRVALKPTTGKPFVIEIGSLTDIADLYPLANG